MMTKLWSVTFHCHVFYFKTESSVHIKMFIPMAGKNPVTDGEVSTIEIQRGEDDQLGISIVGGCDTPLVS